MRGILVVLLFFLLVIIPFLIWGSWFEEFFHPDVAVNRLEASKGWAWLVGIGLLAGDLFLPLPGTIIMSSLGLIYGPLVGGFLAVLGNALGGLCGYGICRALGRKGALFILGQKELERGERLFRKNGGWIVAISRWLPIFPEVISCMAGLNRMDRTRFVIALLCGSIPLGFIFAYVGYLGLENPRLAIVVSAGLPAVLWLIAQKLMRNRFEESGL